MKLDTITEVKQEAYRKWREYRDAAKAHPTKQYKDLVKAYSQLKSGRKLIDIFKVIQKGGRHNNCHPCLAIAKASAKKVTCTYWTDGRVRFEDNETRWNKSITLPNCLPSFTFEDAQPWQNNLRLEAPVPLIPPGILPEKLTSDYYILWEVDEWKMVPPTDPWLLKRVTERLFVVLAGWDLTELEKSVMAGHMF